MTSVHDSRWQHLRRDFATSLRAEGKSPITSRLHLGAVDKLGRWCVENGGPDDPTNLTRSGLNAFTASVTDLWKLATCAVNFRALQQFFAWLVREEEEVDRSPMDRMRAPHVPEQLVPVLTDDQLRSLLLACDGRTSTDRRDAALVRLFLDTGCRRAEVVNLSVDDVHMTDQSVRVIGKGSRIRVVPFGSKTAQALGRYLRLRERERDRWSGLRKLWFGEKGRGPLTDDGIRQMLDRRGAQVGIDNLHAHQFRHTTAHRWNASGAASPTSCV